MKLASKSQKRIDLLDLVTEAITHEDIFGTIDYKKKSEDAIKQFIYPHLVESLTRYVVEEQGKDKETAKELVKKNLKWEGNVNTTVSHILFMGTQNRPDMILELNGLKIAIEFKRGQKGSDLRSGIGQSMISQLIIILYSTSLLTLAKTVKLKMLKVELMKQNSLTCFGTNTTLNLL